MDRAAAETWIAGHVEPVGAIEVVHERPWSTLLRVPLADGAAWFKACEPVQAFEAMLTATLAARWPDRVVPLLAHDEDRKWLLLADAGTSLQALGSGLEAWVGILPLYAELQRGETAHAETQLALGLPDQRPSVLPAAYEELVSRQLPLEADEIARLRAFAPRFAALCAELSAGGIPPTVQHDDLHDANVFSRADRFLIIDWGDSCIAHPFATLLVTFRFLERTHAIGRDDPWFARLRDAYLEPWGDPANLLDTFELAQRVSMLSRALTWARHIDAMPPEVHADYAVALPRALRGFLADVVTRCG